MADDLTAIEPPAPEDDAPLPSYSAAELGLEDAVKSQPLPGEATLSDYKPTAGDSLRQGWDGTTGFAQQFKEYFAAKTIERANLHGVAKPQAPTEGGDLAGVWNANQPSQAELDGAYQTLGVAKARKASDDSFQSADGAGMAAYALGALGKGVAQPENLLQAGAITKGVMGAWAAKSAGEALVRSMLAHGAEAGVVNLGVDSASQALEIGAGLEDHWSWQRSGLAFGLGAGLGGGMAGAATAVGRILDAKRIGAFLRETPIERPSFVDPAKTGEAPSAFLAAPVEPNRFKPVPDDARLETSNPDLAPGVQATENAIATRAPREIDASVSEMTPEEFAASNAAAPQPEGPQLRAALRLDDGSLRVGEPGQIHADLASEAEIDAGIVTSDNQMGFVTRDGAFLSRKQAADYVAANEPARAPKDPTRLEAAEYQAREIQAQSQAQLSPDQRATPTLDEVNAQARLYAPDLYARIDKIEQDLAAARRAPAEGSGAEAKAAKAEIDRLTEERAGLERERQAAHEFGEVTAKEARLPPVDERMIVNPVDLAATPEQKLSTLVALTEENKPIIDQIAHDIDAALGTESKSNVKAPENILSKAARPSILAKKPWHGVEHIRDSLRFKTVLSDIRQIPAIFARLRASGVTIVKADVKKAVAPKEYGFPIISFDIRMKNGQLVEYYMQLAEVEEAKKTGHKIFEKWRNEDTSALTPAKMAEFEADLAESRKLYADAFAAGLARSGADFSDVRASLAQVARMALSDTTDQPSAARSASAIGAEGAKPSPAGATNVDPSATSIRAPSLSNPNNPDIGTSKETIAKAYQDRQEEIAVEHLTPDVVVKGDPNQPTPDMTAHAERMVDAGVTPEIAQTVARRDGQFIGDIVPDMRPHYATDGAGLKIEVQPVVVELRDLITSRDPGFDPSLQPRDRTRAASDAQVRDIVNKFDPEFLGFSPAADSGAPIVGPDRMVESGNGRTFALAEIYANHPDKVAAYHDLLARYGVDVGKYDQPVLVRERVTPLSPGQRMDFTLNANKPTVAVLGASETAMIDARRLTADTLGMIRNVNDLAGGSNADFHRQFMLGLTPAERGAFIDKDNRITQAGITRMRNAVIARAYGDSPVLARVAEASDQEAKSITNALTKAAPEWAKMRAEIDAGALPASLDITADLVEAVGRTTTLRERGISLEIGLAQVDIEGPVPENVADIMRWFYRPDQKIANGQDNIAAGLLKYAEEARKVVSEGLGLVEPTSARELQDLAMRKAHERWIEKGKQGGLFGGQALRAQPLDAPRAGRGDGGNGAAGRGQDAGGAGGGTAGAGLRRLEGGQAGDGPNAQLGPIAQPLRASAQPMATRNGPVVSTTPAAERTFPTRRELPGEAQKPIAMPAGVTPEAIRDFKITNEMMAIANALGRKLEIDGRFTIRGALGEYKPQMGVLRIRHAGDLEVFAHELGHAVDQRLSTQVNTGPRFAQMKRQFEAELRPLDPNTVDPAKQTREEGLAEYLRMYVNNPAYAQKQAPGFAQEFEKLLGQDPQLRDLLGQAQRIAQIDTAMTPMQALAAQVAPPAPRGLIAETKRIFQAEGLRPSLSHLADAVYAGVVGQDHWVGRFVGNLREARFDKTGAPMPLGAKDPYQMFRMLPGAKQAAVDAIVNGVRPYGGHMMQGPVVAGLHEHLSLAFDGRLSRLFEEGDPVVQDFNGYLIARRAAQLFDRFNAGDLRKPPIGASEAKTRQAIVDFEAAHPNFRPSADGVFAFTKAYWDKKFDAGLIPRDVYEAVNAQGSDYVPFMRDMTDLKAEGGGGPSRANGVADNGLRKLKGSSRSIVSPIHSIIEDVAQTERMIAHNDTVKALHKLAQAGGEFSGRYLEQVPNSELKGATVDLLEAIRAKARKEGAAKADTEALIRAMEDLVGPDMTASVYRAQDTTPKGERILFYWDGGERVALKAGNDEISRQFFDVFTMLSTPERDLAMAVIGKANGLFSAMVTNAPEFGLKNLVMDNISRIFIGSNAGFLGRVPGAAIAMGVHASLFDKEFAKAYAAFGGIRGGLVSQAARTLDAARGRGLDAAFAPRTMKEMKAELLGHHLAPANLVKTLAMTPFKAIEKLMKAIEYTETAGRLGQSKIVFRHLKSQGLDDEAALRGAFFEGRDILDYDRRGGSMGAAQKLIPFLNAGIQGTDRALRNLAGGPINAFLEASRRGGYKDLDAATKAALWDGVYNWGMVAAGVGATAGYAFHMANDPRYQKETDYMRRRYYIFYPGGDDKDGNPMKVTLPKPFDLPGAMMSAVEFYVYGMMRQDPETYAKAAKNMLDGFVPRQFMSIDDLLGSSPVIKTGYEAATGMKMPFEGRNPMPIISQDLKALPPEMQFDAYSSWFSKKIGTWFGVSPKRVEHVMDGLGATTSRDVNAVLTAAFDQNPRMTKADALTKFFFGGLYRQDLGGGQARADVMDLMARDNGTYAQLAAGYRRAIETGDDATAQTLFNRGNDTSKTLMVLSSDAAFKPEMRVLHPLVRTEKVGEVASAVLRDLAGGKVNVEDRSRKRGALRETIEVEPATARAIAATVTTWMAEEMRNGLAAVKEPGYGTYPLIDTGARLEAIRALSPDVADEIQGRLDQRRVLPIARLAEEWPKVKDLVLQDRKASAKELARTYKELSK